MILLLRPEVIYQNLGVDFLRSGVPEGVWEGLRFFAANKGTYYVHSTEARTVPAFVSLCWTCLWALPMTRWCGLMVTTTTTNAWSPVRDKE